MGRHHAVAAARAGGEIVAVVDPRIEQARTLAGAGAAMRSLEDARPRSIDVVHVCAPLPDHAQLAEQAISLGAHLVVEKPLAPDATTTRTLLAAAKEHGSLVVPVHQFLFQPGVQRLLSDRNRHGELVRCVFEAATAGAEVTGLDPDELVADILPHPLGLFSRLASADLAEAEWVIVRPAGGELRAIAAADGTTFEIVISTRGRPTRATLDVMGTRASAHADLYHGFAVVERGAGTGVRKLARPFSLAGSTLGSAGANLTRRALSRETSYPGLHELVRRTYVSIATGSPAPIDENEILAVAVARDTILAARALHSVPG
jgi:predicted dehydrogenase